MHALKLYGPRTGRQNSYGAARAPWVDVRFLFKKACEQPGHNPYGDRECDVTWGITQNVVFSVTQAETGTWYCLVGLFPF